MAHGLFLSLSKWIILVFVILAKSVLKSLINTDLHLLCKPHRKATSSECTKPGLTTPSKPGLTAPSKPGLTTPSKPGLTTSSNLVIRFHTPLPYPPKLDENIVTRSLADMVTIDLIFFASMFSTLLISVRDSAVCSLVNWETLLKQGSELRSNGLPVTTVDFSGIRTHDSLRANHVF